MQPTADRESKGFFEGLLNRYDEIWKALVMPARAKYYIDDLGPECRAMDANSSYLRQDDFCMNDKGQRI